MEPGLSSRELAPTGDHLALSDEFPKLGLRCIRRRPVAALREQEMVSLIPIYDRSDRTGCLRYRIKNRNDRSRRLISGNLFEANDPLGSNSRIRRLIISSRRFLFSQLLQLLKAWLRGRDLTET